MKANVRSIFIILDVIYFFTFIATFTCIIYNYISLKGTNFGYLLSICENWKSHPILKINKNFDCKQNLITEKWPGTIEGCVYNNRIHRGVCTDGVGVRIAPIGKVPFTYWRGINLCSEKIQIGYINITLAENDSSCPLGTKSCGVVDSKNNVMCLDLSQECPLNHIEFINSDDLASIKGIERMESLKIEGGYLISGRVSSTQERILIQFALEEAQPCLDTNYKNYVIKPFFFEKFYQDEKCYEGFGDEKYDPRWVYLDSDLYYKIFQDNGIFQLMFGFVDFSEKIEEIIKKQPKINLYGRSYIGLSIKCHDYIKENKMSRQIFQEIRGFDKICEEMSFMAFFSIFFESMAILLNIIFYFIYNSHFYNLNDEITIKKFKNKILINVVCCIPYVLSFAINSCIFSNLKSNSTNFYILADPECSDKFTYISASENMKKIEFSKRLCLPAIIGTLYLFIIPFVCLIIFRKNFEKEYKKLLK
jgi:hypothetical protein